MTKKEVIVPADDLVCLGKDKLQELIRCKDCKHYTKEGHVRCWNPHGMHPADPDEYCSRAERREK